MAVMALCRMTVADFIRQPLTWLMTALSLGLVGLSLVFGLFNFETQDRLRMLCTAGVAITVINGLFLAVVGASSTVHDELASRTALTLFAKPLSRSSFLVGKALGVWLTVAASCLVVAAAHLAVVAIAASTEFELSAKFRHAYGDDLWVPWAALLAAHGLGLAHGAVMVCLATALALRLPLVANILCCFAVFVLGHILAGMKLMGAVVVPALALFNIDDALQLPQQTVSWAYFSFSLVYAALYGGGCLLLALAVFKRQDIP